MKEALPPGRDGAFPRTRWTLVEDLRLGGKKKEKALAELCAMYWQPVHSFLQRNGTHPAEVEDRVQGFFQQLLEHDSLSRADSGKGTLRSFLLTALKRFCVSEYRRETRQKRGGGAGKVSLDDTGCALPEPAGEEDPESIFERQWAVSLLDEALARVRSSYEETGKSELFAALSPFLAGREKVDPRYGDLAEGLGITAGAVQVAVHRMRKRYRLVFEEVVGETVEDPAAVEEEIRHVLSILTS